MISKQAYVHPGARLGKDVTLEPFAYLAEDVVIGEGTWIGPGAVVMDGARVGRECRIFPGAVISAIPQDMKFSGEYTIAEIGDFTTIRESATVNRGTVAAGKTIVGNNCLLMAYSHVAHDCVVGNHCILVNSVALGGEVRMGDWAIMGGMSSAHQFTLVGAHAMIAAGTTLRKDVPPYILVGDSPVAYMGINKIGLSRRGFSQGKIEEIHNIYRIIYQSKRNTSQSLAYIGENFEPTPERDYILDFISGSERGILRRK